MKTKIIWIDFIRIFAMLLVVFGHALYTSGHTNFGSYEFPNSTELYSIPYKIFIIAVSFIYSFHMPLFMAISGACFALSSGRKPIPVRTLIRNKTKRLLIPFFWTSLCLSIPIRILLGYYEDTGNNPIYIFAHHFIFPFQIHTWFLLSLFLIFPLFILLRPLHNKNKYIFWTLLIILSYIGNKSEIPLQALLGLPEALKLLLYFAIGFYSINYFLKHNPKQWVLATSILIQFIAFLCWAYILEPLGNSYYFCIILALWGCYNTTALCIILSKSEKLINSKIYNILLKYNFQIYLYSDPFNYLFLMAIFSIGFIDFFGNPIHTVIATIVRIVFGIIFGVVVAKFVEKLSLKNNQIKLSI